MNSDNPSNVIPDNARLPGPFRRIAALIYDLLAVLALCLLGSLLPVLMHGEAITIDDGWRYGAFLIYNAILATGYFVISWRLKHCTIGMKAWRLELVNQRAGQLDWQPLLIRAWVGLIAWIPAGLGVWAQYASADRLTWHDRASGTRMVVLKKR